MSRRKRTLAVVLAIVLVVVGGLFTWVQLGAPGRYRQLGTAVDVIAIVATEYVDPVSTWDLVRAYAGQGTINGMLHAVLHDRYSHYFTPAQYNQMKIDTSGEFDGIGVMIGQRDDHLVVIAPIPGSPGAQAGIKPGDEIVSIDGQPVSALSLEETAQRLRGESGSVVEIGLVSGSGTHAKPRVVRVIRQHIDVPSVTASRVIKPGAASGLARPVGYIRLAAFTEQTPREFDTALTELERQGIQGLVFDLRNNPGGLLSAAVSVVSHFVDQGPVLFVAGRDGQKRVIAAEPHSDVFAGPVVILVNQNSASASEIVAGALKDRGVAKLVGQQTFGKGLVQTVFPLRSGGALSLTTARYLTAGGHDIQSVGIAPDVAVSTPPATDAAPSVPNLSDPALKAALKVLHDDLATPAATARKAA